MEKKKKVSDTKGRMVKALVEEAKAAEYIFDTELGGVRANDLITLRRQLNDIGGEFVVVKNSLAKRALEESDYTPLVELLKGTIGLGLCSSDAVACSKVLTAFAKGREAFVIKGAMLDGQLIGHDDVKVLAALPSREVLLTRIVSTMQAPIRGLAYVLNENIRKLAYILNEITKHRS